MKASGSDKNKLKSVELDQFIDSLDFLDGSQLSILNAAWHSIDRPRHETVWNEVRDVAKARRTERGGPGGSRQGNALV